MLGNRNGPDMPLPTSLARPSADVLIRSGLAVTGVALAGLALCLVPGATTPLRIAWAAADHAPEVRRSLGGCLFCAGAVMLAVAAWPGPERGR